MYVSKSLGKSKQERTESEDGKDHWKMLDEGKHVNRKEQKVRMGRTTGKCLMKANMLINKLDIIRSTMLLCNIVGRGDYNILILTGQTSD